MWQIELSTFSVSSWPPVAAGPHCFPIRGEEGTYQNPKPLQCETIGQINWIEGHNAAGGKQNKGLPK